MNVLFVIHAPVFGGPHNTIAVMDQLHRSAGINTLVLLPEEGQDAAIRLRQSGVDVVTMPMHRMRAVSDPRVHLRWVRALRSEVTHIVELIEQHQIDVVVATSLPNLQAGLAARRADVACVWQLLDSFSPPAVRRIYMSVVRVLADVVMTTGIRIAEQHPGATSFGARWVPFFPCVDVNRFRSDAEVRRSARAELGLPADALVIGNVSNINPMKGHRTFIQAAAKLLQRYPDTRFVILGARYENHRTYYEALLAEATALGLVVGGNLVIADPKDRVHELAQAFDLFWMTSEPQSEGIPTVIGEAKSLGLPVVTTDVGSTSECVTDGVSGYVVRALDPRAIADATGRILDDEPGRVSMGLAARREAERDYAASQGAAAHGGAYELAIRHRSEFPRSKPRGSVH